MPNEDYIPAALPSPGFSPEDLDGVERRLVADSADWERGVPSPDSFNSRLRRRLMEESMREQETSPSRGWRTERITTGADEAPPAPDRRPPGRTRTLLAAVAAVVIVGLLAAVFASLTRGRAGQSPAGSATASATVAATATVRGTSVPSTPTPVQVLATQQVVTQQPGTPVVAPSDPNVIYEYADNGSGVVLRRSDDGGETWRDLSYPGNGAFVAAIEVAVSPVDARNVFLRLDLGYQPGGQSPCQAIAETQHGGMLASSGANCRVELYSRDGGAHWSKMTLPVPGELFQSGVTFNYDTTTIQAGADRLYGNVWQLDANGQQTGDIRIASTRDDGESWQAADDSLVSQAGHICAFSSAARGMTVFAVTSTTTCWANPAGARSMWRSDDGGGHWVRAGDLPVALAENGAIFVAASEVSGQGMTATLYGIPGAEATRGAVEAEASSDGGQTWHAAPSRGLPNGALVMGVAGNPLADGSILVAVEAAAGTTQQAGGSASPTATATATEATYGVQPLNVFCYIWKAGDTAWQQVTAAGPVDGPSVTNVFAASGSRLVVTLSSADDMSSNPMYTLRRFL